MVDAGPPGWSAATECRVADANLDPTLRAILDALTIRLGPDVPTLSIEDLLAAAGAPAISIAVRRGAGEPILAAAYGDSLSGAVLSPTTMFQAGSISKPVWAFSLMTRSDTAAWLDTDVRAALPELPSTHPVTPRMLLTHTSGATVSGFNGYRPGEARPTLREVVLGLPPANTAAVTFAPSGPYEYSGGGMETLEWWFSASEGMNVPAFADAALFDPVGLSRTLYAQPLPPSESDHACGLSTQIAPGECYRIHPETVAAGLWSTPSDLSCLATYVSLERPEILARARTAAVTIPGWPQSMGFGIRYRDLGGGVRLYEHGGINFGFVSWWLFFDDGRSIVVMSNTRTAYSLQVQIVWNICRGLGWPCTQPGFLP